MKPWPLVGNAPLTLRSRSIVIEAGFFVFFGDNNLVNGNRVGWRVKQVCQNEKVSLLIAYSSLLVLIICYPVVLLWPPVLVLFVFFFWNSVLLCALPTLVLVKRHSSTTQTDIHIGSYSLRSLELR